MNRGSFLKYNARTTRFMTIYVGVMTVIVALYFYLGKQEPIRVGFVGPLTGRSASLGVAVLNGVLLAAQVTNEAGGIDGKKIEIAVKDDAQDRRRAVPADEELIREGIKVVVGHMTSAMSKAATPLLENGQIVMISPTTSSNDLSGKDDFFIRLYSPGSSMVADCSGDAERVPTLLTMRDGCFVPLERQ